MREGSFLDTFICCYYCPHPPPTAGRDGTGLASAIPLLDRLLSYMGNGRRRVYTSPAAGAGDRRRVDFPGVRETCSSRDGCCIYTGRGTCRGLLFATLAADRRRGLRAYGQARGLAVDRQRFGCGWGTDSALVSDR